MRLFAAVAFGSTVALTSAATSPPLSESLVGLLERLETRVRHDVALEKQYTVVEEALESMINLANTDPGETSATEAPSY
jgi:hypothetical protein